MVYYSPLRYPGGKGKIVPYFKEFIYNNELLDCVYVEPYAGGGSVGLTLLFDGYVSKIIINDIDRSIYAFWYSVLNETEALCEIIEKTPVNIHTWRKQKNLQKKKNKYSLLKLGFSTFFLNRTNRSGIIEGGIIGGKKQTGTWKINARYNKKELIARIKKIAQYRSRIKLHNSDASKLLRSLTKTLPKKTLIYLDPPYYVKGRNLYINHYLDKDHRKLSQLIQTIENQHWIITYDNVSAIRTLYSTYRQKEYDLNYSASSIRTGQELMIFSNNVEIPIRTVFGYEPETRCRS